VADPSARLSAHVHELLRAAGATIATAESLTGGRLAAVLTGTPGASATYVGGVVTYATELKQSLLGVEEALVERYGVVSAECARAMAAGVRAITGATYGLATTGVAGPTEQEGRAVGTVFVGLAGPGLDQAVALELSGKRDRIQDRTCREALSAIEAVLRREETPVR
jgi:nicotinamide-nucleotide amidase